MSPRGGVEAFQLSAPTSSKQRLHEAVATSARADSEESDASIPRRGSGPSSHLPPSASERVQIQRSPLVSGMHCPVARQLPCLSGPSGHGAPFRRAAANPILIRPLVAVLFEAAADRAGFCISKPSRVKHRDDPVHGAQKNQAVSDRDMNEEPKF